MKTQTNHTTKPRSGFTLLELLIVIVIISVLMGLILVGITGVLRRARIVSVQTEFTQLDQALTTFENRFNTIPPSFLQIPAMGGTWDIESRSAVRAIWPQFNFARRGGLDDAIPVPPALTLNGAECLVFFLGGLESTTNGVGTTTGFSKDPQLPWTQSDTPEGPFFEFDSGRFVDTDGDDLFEYVDAIEGQVTPILFLSSRGKRYTESNNAAATDDYDVFGVAANDMQICYFEADGTTPHRKDSYQLISPGDDGEYGPGGIYASGQSLADFDIDGDAIINSDEERQAEKDNITNFSDGTLE